MKKIIILLFAVAVGLGAYWFFSMSDDQAPTQDTQQNETETKNDEQTKVEEVPNALEGELKVSTDKKRGNYMLLLNDSDRIIYLNTSRDFSSLVGKQVLISIDGSLDDFRLIDIKAK
jgi:hypothetical protein